MTPSSTDGTRIIRASMLNQIVWYAQPNRLSVSCGLTEKVDPNRGKCSTRRRAVTGHPNTRRC